MPLLGESIFAIYKHSSWTLNLQPTYYTTFSIEMVIFDMFLNGITSLPHVPKFQDIGKFLWNKLNNLAVYKGESNLKMGFILDPGRIPNRTTGDFACSAVLRSEWQQNYST